MQAAPLSQGQFASEGTKQEAVTTAPEASTTEEQEDQPAEAADDALGSALDDGDDDVDLGYDEEVKTLLHDSTFGLVLAA